MTRPGTYTHNSGKQGHRPAFDAFIALQEMPSSQFLVFRITAPWTYRHLVPVLRHVLKPTMVKKELFLLVENFECLAHFLPGLLKDVSPSLEDVAFGNGAVVC